MKKRCVLFSITFMFCMFLSFNPNFQQLVKLPDHYLINKDEIQLTGVWSKLIKVEIGSTNQSSPVLAGIPNIAESQKMEVSYKLFGIFPLSSGEVQVMKPMNLVPGGQSIGVTLKTKGVMVVGQAPVVDKTGAKVFPAKEAGIVVGDILLKINNQEVRSDLEVSNAVQRAGEQKINADVIYKHKDRVLQKNIIPIFCIETGKYRIGLFVRDEAAGVGTLSFIDPISKQYGALGHVITDADTNQKIEVSNGKIMASTIYAIEKGKRGHPGEKSGSFVLNSTFNGTIEKNTMTGIFGTMKGELANPFYKQAIPVGWESEVKVGPAKIYTVIKGEKIEEFEVNIDRVMHNRADSKNMIVRVTDPRLLEVTGGIVQGMSGSPIVQNGKIIGAVTHVFVNDSERGYGVFIQNMVKECNQLTENKAA